MGSSGVNWVSTGLASLDQASAGRHSCFCFECCSFPCCLLLSFGCVLLATLATRDLSFAVCYMSRACVLYVACRASPVSRAARCVLPAGAQHVSSPLCISSRLLLCVFDEIVSRFRPFWQRIAVVNDFKEACKAHNKRVSYRFASDLVFYESLLLRKQSVSLTTAILCQNLRKPDMFGMLRRFKCTSQVGATMKATCLEKR